MKKNILKFVLAFLVFLPIFSKVSADNSVLPNMMVGQTTVNILSNNHSLVTNGQGYVQINNANSLGSSGLIVSAWIKSAPTSAPVNASATVISIGGRQVTGMGSDAAGWAMGIKNSGTNYYLLVSAGNGTNGNSVPSSVLSENPYDGNWHSVVFAYKSSGQIDFYFDGLFINSAISGIPSGIATASTIYIGSRYTSSPTTRFVGDTDEVKIYNGYLSAGNGDILASGALVNAETDELKSDASTAPIVGWWQFNNDPSGQVIDSTGKNGAGTLTSGATETGDNVLASSTPGTYYGATTGNEAIYNPTNDNGQPTSTSKTGYNLIGFDQSSLASCVGGIITGTSAPNCFVINTAGSEVSLMTSRISINGSDPKLEVSTILYPSKNLIAGDSNLGSIDPSNFAYWGRHLTENSGSQSSSDAYADINNYTINPNAQSNLSGAEYSQYKAKVDIENGEATLFGNIASTHTLQLQTDGSDVNQTESSSGAGKAKYPEGRIWKTAGSLTLSGSYSYNGQGTIIVNGNLNINSGANILPPTGDTTSRLGFIVYGNVTISGGNNIQAAILALGSSASNLGVFSVSGNNVNLTGSFAANKFTNINNLINIHFYYDPNFSTSWPPGFRDLQMPSPVQ